MEKKLTVHKNKSHAPVPALFNQPFSLPNLWNSHFLSPWWSSDMQDVTRENFDRMLDGVFGILPAPAMQNYADITEDKKSFQIKMDVPGLEADDIDISAEDGMLVISADKEEKEEDTESRYSFSYSLTLPQGADIDQADVSLSNSKLSINIPKKNGVEHKLTVNKTKPDNKPEKKD